MPSTGIHSVHVDPLSNCPCLGIEALLSSKNGLGNDNCPGVRGSHPRRIEGPILQLGRGRAGCVSNSYSSSFFLLRNTI
jgi:hypothetical protein